MTEKILKPNALNLRSHPDELPRLFAYHYLVDEHGNWIGSRTVKQDTMQPEELNDDTVEERLVDPLGRVYVIGRMTLDECIFFEKLVERLLPQDG